MAQRVSALGDEHRKLGAAMTEWNGFPVAGTYAGQTVEQEHDAVREAAGLYDLSAFSKLWVTGPDAREVLNRAVTRDISKLKPGRGTYAMVLTDEGTITDDGIVFCYADDRFCWVIGTGGSGDRIAEVAKGKNVKLEWDNEVQVMSLQGPKAVDVLAENASGDVRGLKFFQQDDFTLFGRNVRISRTGYSGERGYEIFAKPEDAPHIWQKLLEAGKPHGVLPCSFASLIPIRVEAGLLFYPFDANEENTPWEVGAGFLISKDKGDFLGRDAVLAKEGKERHVLRGASATSSESIFGEETGLYKGGKKVGTVVGPAYSSRMGKSLAMVFVDPDVKEGDKVTLGQGADAKELAIEDLPFYDKNKERLRG